LQAAALLPQTDRATHHVSRRLVKRFTAKTATVKRTTEKRATENWTTGKIGSEKRKGRKNWQQKLVTEIRTAIFQLPFLPFTCQTATQL